MKYLGALREGERHYIVKLYISYPYKNNTRGENNNGKKVTTMRGTSELEKGFNSLCAQSKKEINQIKK